MGAIHTISFIKIWWCANKNSNMKEVRYSNVFFLLFVYFGYFAVFFPDEWPLTNQTSCILACLLKKKQIVSLIPALVQYFYTIFIHRWDQTTPSTWLELLKQQLCGTKLMITSTGQCHLPLDDPQWIPRIVEAPFLSLLITCIQIWLMRSLWIKLELCLPIASKGMK